MKFSFKLFNVVLLLIMIPMLLVSCGGGGDNPGGNEGDGPVTIKFNYSENQMSRKAWTDLIAAYNNGQGKTDNVFVIGSNTGVETPTASLFTKGVNYAYNVIALVDSQDSFQNLAIKKDAKNAPNGYFLNLEPYAEADEDFKNNTINPELLNWWRMTYNANAKQGSGQEKHVIGAGQTLLGVPYGTKQQFNWYNKELFKAQGINIISIEEEKLDAYNQANGTNIMPHGYAEYKNLPYEGAQPSTNLDGKVVYKVFNPLIGMNFEEQRVFLKYFTKSYNSNSTTNYGFVSEYWFNYGWSVGSDVMGFNGTDYDFTLMDKTPNYIVTKDNTVVNGVTYNAGEIVRYVDKVGDAGIATKDGVYAIASGYTAIKEYLSLQVEKTNTVDGTDKGYGVATPDTDNMLNLFTTEQVAMVRRNNAWTIKELTDSNLASHFDVCVPEQYREYVGGSTYYKGSQTFANEYLKVIGETYDGQVYTGALKEVDGTKIVGKKTCAANTMGLVIPACSDPAKYQAAWNFISWVATEGQQYVAYMGDVAPVAKDVLFSDKYATNAEFNKKLNYTALAITAYNAGRGDWGYFENGRWVTDWANDFNQNVRKGRKTMTQFFDANATAAKQALDNMYCVITGIR